MATEKLSSEAQKHYELRVTTTCSTMMFWRSGTDYVNHIFRFHKALVAQHNMRNLEDGN